MSHSVTPPGFFGKVPALGDFLARRLPAGFQATWEAWLSAWVLAATGHAWSPNPDLPAARAAFAERLARQEPPMGFLRAIRAALPADGIYVEDVTQVGFASRLAFPVPAPRRFLSPGYQDTLGWGSGP
ncbi:MAG: DUF2094 domain-containing protein, partial [Rhodospirillales bacterium]|nr:DUF2094 domain-containing protein [Rhodospirillales bacterium]